MDSQQIRHLNEAWQKLEHLTTLGLFNFPSSTEIGDVIFPLSLTSLTINISFNNRHDYSSNFRILNELPSLEYLELLHCSDAILSEKNADYIAASNSLLKLRLVFYLIPSSEVLESVLSRVSSSKIVSFSLVIVPIGFSLSAKTLFNLIQSAKFYQLIELSGIQCPELAQDPNQLVKLQQLVDSHPFLQSLTVGDIVVHSAHNNRSNRPLYDKETGHLVRFTRLLAGYKLGRPLRLPMEIILHIFKINALEATPTNSHHLNLIMKCLFDRRTLGRVRSEVMPFSLAVLYSKCARALNELE